MVYDNHSSPMHRIRSKYLLIDLRITKNEPKASDLSIELDRFFEKVFPQ